MVGVNKQVLENRIKEILFDLGSQSIGFANTFSLMEAYSHKYNSVNGQRLNTKQLLERSIKSINYHVSRFSSENVALSTLKTLNNNVRDVNQMYEYILKRETENYEMLKLKLTHLEVALSLDVTFIDSLWGLYNITKIKPQKRTLDFKDIERYYNKNMEMR